MTPMKARIVQSSRLTLGLTAGAARTASAIGERPGSNAPVRARPPTPSFSVAREWAGPAGSRLQASGGAPA